MTRNSATPRHAASPGPCGLSPLPRTIAHPTRPSPQCGPGLALFQLLQEYLRDHHAAGLRFADGVAEVAELPSRAVGVGPGCSVSGVDLRNWDFLGDVGCSSQDKWL